ncbi:hypothetical protein [Jannaschia donghaensis]|uniref:Uncharacterized protein n=1 Tax=Jannaschia donghaensis TaxID=420998 RepID=A0A0M6YFW0_9RHOB|nr:hypothetical protein [Jannaschia donghaensis]CTQ48157.1 hypothetical protein JDO7802_00159 [Jannaschia donghaensis]
MNGCLNLPFWGQYCVGDLTFRMGGFSLDLLHPGVITTLLLGSVLYIYIFKNPT